MEYGDFCALKVLIVLGLLHSSIVECRVVPETPTAAGPCKFAAIFNFGDSNSDTGGLSAAFGEIGSPAGETFFGHPAGRYCDGRLKIDFIAESFGLPFLSAYLDSVGTNFSHGANFATAGSTIRPQNTTLRQSGFSPVSLLDQFVEFSDFYHRAPALRKGIYTELLPTAEAFTEALYTFDIGQNDLTAGYFSRMSTDQVKDFVPDLILNLSNIIRYIYARGGRYFWIHNTGPVGCLPYVMDTQLITAGQVDHIGCADPFNEVAKYFNSKLKEAVSQLRDELPLAALTYVDVNSVMYDLYEHATKYGFQHPLKACCGHGGKFNYNQHHGCGSPLGQSCKEPSKAINWDGVHYTEAGNKWVFDKIVNGSYSDPPIPLHMACHRNP
ncbi:GDSL esterase/lipase-like protein [Drosera capensis]